MNHSMPSRTEAEALLNWAYAQNPGPWADHSRVVARIAQVIASHCGLDEERAYLSGLIHDIGRYEGVRGMHHIIAGYDLLMEKGYQSLAQICLTHSFSFQNIAAFSSANDCSPEERAFITSYLAEKTYDDYDRLIQLGDSMGTAKGVCLMDVRLVDVVRRYGFNDFTLRKWDTYFNLKAYFDKLCHMNIYDLFYDEIRDISFR